jgi:hypothetical protein
MKLLNKLRTSYSTHYKVLCNAVSFIWREAGYRAGNIVVVYALHERPLYLRH